MIIDLPSDKGLAHFHALSRILTLPDFVKQADFTEQVEVDELPSTSFADALDRKFPIHTKAAAYLSYAYFQSQRGGMDKAAVARCNQGFNKAAEFWGLAWEMGSVVKSMHKAATVVESKFALTHEDQNFFPINSCSEILKSASELVQARSMINYEGRKTAAKNIMKAAAEAGLPTDVLPEAVHRMAGFGLTTKKAALTELNSRWNTEKRSALANPLYACMVAVENAPAEVIGGELCEKIAAVIEQYDQLVEKRVSHPEDVLFAFTKHAADKLASNIVTMVDGTCYNVGHLSKAADAFTVLGDSIVNSIKDLNGSINQIKAAELIETLPRTDAELLKVALATMGVHPAKLDKTAAVAEVAEAASTARPMTVLHKKAEKRADVLASLEAADPMVKRALDVLRRLHAAEKSACDDCGCGKDKCKCDDKDDDGEKKNKPRGLRGLFINKAPNDHETKPAK